MRKIIFVFPAVSLLVFVACSSLTHHKDVAALAKIKKVAITGFTVFEPAPPKLAILTGKIKAGGSGLYEKSSVIDQMYAELTKRFGQNVRWTVISPQALKGSPAYRKAYDATMKGFHNRMPPGAEQNRYLAEGIMDDQAARILNTDGRTALIRDLGVDGIVSATVQVQLTGTTVMGFGSRHVQSVLSFSLYTQNKNSPDWFEGNLEGSESAESFGITDLFGGDKLHQLGLASLRTAFGKLGR